MAGSFFDSFSAFVGSVGNAVGQATGAIGNFITQREQLRLQRAQAQARLAAAQQQARLASAAQVQPVQASNAQRQAPAAAGGLPATIAGIPTATLLLLVGAVMVYKVVK